MGWQKLAGRSKPPLLPVLRWVLDTRGLPSLIRSAWLPWLIPTNDRKRSGVPVLYTLVAPVGCKRQPDLEQPETRTKQLNYSMTIQRNHTININNNTVVSPFGSVRPGRG